MYIQGSGVLSMITMPMAHSSHRSSDCRSLKHEEQEHHDCMTAWALTTLSTLLLQCRLVGHVWLVNPDSDQIRWSSQNNRSQSNRTVNILDRNIVAHDSSTCLELQNFHRVQRCVAQDARAKQTWKVNTTGEEASKTKQFNHESGDQQ